MPSLGIPYFSFVSDGVDWFKSHDKWIDGSEVDSFNYDKVVYPGMIIFFDWETDGNPNHVGIVTKVENGYIYTVEGNSSNAVREKSYSADSVNVFGFGAMWCLEPLSLYNPFIVAYNPLSYKLQIIIIQMEE